MPTLRFATNLSAARPGSSATLGAVAVPILLSGAFFTVPLSAQAVGRVEVSGHVAPRCWTLAPVTVDAAALANPDSRSSVAARCNHAATPISVQLRRTAANRSTSERTGEAPAPQSVAEGIATSRAAIEIILSPTL